MNGVVRMKNLKSILSILLINMVLVSNTFAATGWTGPRTILSLEVTEAGTEIRLDGFGGTCTSLLVNVQMTWVRIGSAQTNKE